MLDSNLSKYLTLEESRKNYLLNNNLGESEKIKNELAELYLELQDDLGGKKFNHFFNLFQQINIPVSLLTASSMQKKDSTIKKIDKNEFNDFFKNYFNIDISSIDIIHVTSLPQHAEGYAETCGIDKHYIVLPQLNSEYFLSKDLIVHELGHTTEYLVKRTHDLKNGIVHFPIISETIAHYFQFYYMLKTCSKVERIGVLASITEAYFFYKSMLIMFINDNNASTFDYEIIVHHPLFTPFIEAYDCISLGPITLLDELINRYDGKSMLEKYMFPHSQRLGAFLAFNFLKHNLDVQKLFSVQFNQENIDLEECLKSVGLDPALV